MLFDLFGPLLGPLLLVTAVDSIKMYGDGNATKLVRDTTGMVDQVTSGLKDATGIDLTELLSSFHQPFQPREDNE